MRLQFRFGGDYQREFGGPISRPWKVYHVIHNNEIIGTLEKEPESYKKRYRFKTDSDFQAFVTYKELKKYIEKSA